MWLLYDILLIIGLLGYLPKALWRKRLPHRGWMMRLGRYPATVHQRLNGRRAIWVHAVSVGEVLAVQPLIQRFLTDYPDTPLVLSTITPAGFEVASRLLGDRGVTIYSPLDFRLTVRRTLQVIQPRILLLVESELWPNLIRLLKQRHIPVVVVNGRVSERACRRYLWVRPWVKALLGSLEALLMQTEVDAERVIRMGAPAARVRVLGSLKWDASLLTRPTRQDLDAVAARLGVKVGDPLIVAGSTHRGEEEVVLQTFRTLRASHPSLRLLLAPRHLERVVEVEALIRQYNFTSLRTSQASHLGDWEVGLVDTMGQLALYYGLATVTFIGGSLIPHGGQNPLEPAGLGKPIVFGPFMHNFADIARQLLSHQAAQQLASGAELVSVLSRLLADGVEACAIGRHAQELIERSGGSTQRTLDALKALLTPSPSTT